MIKFDLGIQPPIDISKELTPRFGKIDKIIAVRTGNVLKVFSLDGFYTYVFEGVKENTPERIRLFDNRHIRHVVDCYKTGAEIIVPYEVAGEIAVPDFSEYVHVCIVPLSAIKAVKHSSAPETIKPIFNSVCAYASGTFQGVAATDGTRLSYQRCDLSPLLDAVIMPLEFVNIINADVEILQNEAGKYIFKSGNLYCTQNVDGQFPQVQNVIPKYEYLQHSLIVEDLPTLQEYFNMFNQGVSSVIFEGDKKITINRTHSLPLNYSMSPDAPRVAIRFTSLMDSLRVSNKFRYNGGMSPLLFTDGKHSDVVMPIQLKDEVKADEV